MYLPAPGRWVSQVHRTGTVSGVPCVSSGELISGCDTPDRYQPPGSQKDVVINGEPAHGLVEDAVSGAKIPAAPCLAILAVAQLPLCLCRGRALCGSCLSLLCYLLNLLFCEHARGHRMELEPLVGKDLVLCCVFVFVFVFVWFLWHGLGCYLTLAPSDCPQGIQDQSLP